LNNKARMSPSPIPIMKLPKIRCSIEAHIKGVPAFARTIDGRNNKTNIGAENVVLVFMVST
jgi:hypothetical protein